MKPSPVSGGAPPVLVCWILWAALAGSVVVYFLILRFGLVEVASGGAPGGLAGPLLTAGMLFGIASTVPRHFAARFRHGDAPGKVFAAFVAGLALAEVPGIFGLVLGLTGHGDSDTLPLFAVSFLALLLGRPSGYFRPREGA